MTHKRPSASEIVREIKASAAKRHGRIKPPSQRPKMPKDAVDVTGERAGTMIAFIGVDHLLRRESE